MSDRPRPSRATESTRCPACGFTPSLVGDDDGIIRLPARCLICNTPLARTADHPSRKPDPGLEAMWLAWLESRRVERWIWFLFMVGLAIAATVGLVRGA
ncbi:MAG: hypothetical protein CMJ23_12795 [Phycisphaerae bacterium]|nr:hypothetical protein [Phycisphaerae bacterium]